MDLPRSNQIDIPPWNFTCTACGKCCNSGWHLQVTPEEKQRLATFDWGDEPAIPARQTIRLAGRDYLAHKPNGACVFLDETNQHCRIRDRFGYDARPLGCRIYPYSIVPTFGGHYSVIGRFDCPAIRANDGAPIAREREAIRQYLGQLPPGEGIASHHLDELTEATAIRLVHAIHDRILGDAALPAPVRLVMTVLAIDRFEIMGHTFLNETDLSTILPSFVARLRTDLGHQRLRRLSRFEHWRYLAMLAGYLRRDEELLGKGPTARLRRTGALAAAFFGKTRLRDLGREHPDVILDRRQLFGTPIPDAAALDWSLLLDLVRLRLQAYQFFGPANGGLGFFAGLRSLLLIFPLTIGYAKTIALGRGLPIAVTAADLDQAVGAIDHSFGRSALFRLGLYATITRQMTEPHPYMRLVNGLLG